MDINKVVNKDPKAKTSSNTVKSAIIAFNKTITEYHDSISKPGEKLDKADIQNYLMSLIKDTI